MEILYPSFQYGAKEIAGADTFSQNSNSLSYAEKSAYDWIRTETNPDALCVTNVILNDSQYESFIIGVCTERQIYMESWKYIAGYIDEDTLLQR